MRRSARWISCCLFFALSLASASCSEGGDETRRPDWNVGPPGEADAGDTGVESDTERDCRSIDDQSRCESTSGCKYVHFQRRCGTGEDGGLCMPEGAPIPGPPACPPCANIDDEERCRTRQRCSWTSKECPGGEEVGACGGPAEGAPKLECPDAPDQCAQRRPEVCNPGQCEIHRPGCGSDDAFDGGICLRGSACSDSEECGGEARCREIVVEPDCDQCRVCGQTISRCAPREWTEDG